MTGLPKAGREAPHLCSTTACHNRNQLLRVSQKPHHTILNLEAAEKGSKAISGYATANGTGRPQETEIRA